MSVVCVSWKTFTFCSPSLTEKYAEVTVGLWKLKLSWAFAKDMAICNSAPPAISSDQNPFSAFGKIQI